MLLECPRFERVRLPEWRRKSEKRILRDGKEEERLLEYIRNTGVGLKPSGEIVEDIDNWRDRLNERMDFMRE